MNLATYSQDFYNNIEGKNVPQSGWLCARTLPHKERFAEENLAKNGLTVYCPRYQKWISSARQNQFVNRPLFPGYLFVRKGEDLSLFGILKRSPGISTIVGVRNSFSLLSDSIISNLKNRHNESGFIEINQNNFKKGDRVKLTDQRFSDIEGIFEEQDDLRRSVILIKMLGKAHRVKVLTNYLEIV